MFLGLTGPLFAAACGSSASNAPDAGTAPDAADPVVDASTLFTFSYTPSWAGVQTVEVLGKFDTASDWTAPFVTLTANGGTFTASAQLTPGPHPYVLHVVGDAAAGAQAAKLSRYAIDPASAMFTACPTESPTYSATEPNPCGVAQAGAAATEVHVRGKVVHDGAAAAGYLVVLERDEAASHHFFVDRSTTAADGTYDFSAAAGSYRLQVQHPDYEAKQDADLAPDQLTMVRRTLSSAFPVAAADVAIADAEVAFHDYAKLLPRTTATLPTTFSFDTGAVPAHLEVYGTAKQGVGDEIGDPWFTGDPTKTGSSVFDGTFTTKQAAETAVALGERYFWGIERATAPDASGLTWDAQSLVFPITWH